MSILEPEPERTMSLSNFKKILQVSNILFNKLKGIKEDEVIKNSQNDIVKMGFELRDKVVREIMTSRTDTFIINIEDDIVDILDELKNVEHSKIPVYEKNVDNIIGILNIEDLKNNIKKVESNLHLRNLLSKPYFIPETTQVNLLFNSLNEKSPTLFILVDEYGGFSGIVTAEDLEYDIKGITSDNQNLKEHKIKKIDDNNYIAKGFLTISEFNEIFEENIEQGDYDTLNGYIINQLGQIPNENENIQLNLGKLMLKLIKINNRRIEDIQISILY